MHTTIRMTLTGAMEGKTIKLNGHHFVKGQCDFTGQATEIDGVTKYFSNCYQVKVSIPSLEEKVQEPEPEPEPAAENESEPNERQVEIIEAVNLIDKADWVDLHAVAHPKVIDVSGLMQDPTVTKVEIIEVIEKWLS